MAVMMAAQRVVARVEARLEVMALESLGAVGAEVVIAVPVALEVVAMVTVVEEGVAMDLVAMVEGMEGEAVFAACQRG
jgi:hypothetical protein